MNPPLLGRRCATPVSVGDTPPRRWRNMSRVVKFLGRTKAYFIECKQNMAPMPNPDWYEAQSHTRVSLKNLRELPLSEHVKVWSSTWRWYKGSFEDSFAWSRKRKEEAKKKEAEEKVNALQGMINNAREATHNTPEDLEKSKQALKELLKEVHENRDGLKSAAQEKLDLIRVSLSEFSAAYRESRDEEIKRVMAMDKSVLQSFLHERVDEVKHATSIISDAFVDEDKHTAATEGGGPKKPATTTAAAAAAPGEASAGARAGTGGGDIIPAGDSDAEGSGGGGCRGPGRFLSQRTRQAVDDVLRDPDIERLSERARGFARERLLQAEAAARVITEDDGDEDSARQRRWRRGHRGEEAATEEEEVKSGKHGAGEGRMRPEVFTEMRDSQGGEGETKASKSETPIISGLASKAREFVAGRVGEAKEGAREIVVAATDARRSRLRQAAAAKDGVPEAVGSGGASEGLEKEGGKNGESIGNSSGADAEGTDVEGKGEAGEANKKGGIN